MSRLPALPYVVVDTNQLRVREVVEPLLEEFNRSGQRIMLPWTSTYELTKGTGNNFVGSMRWLKECSEAVSVAYAAIATFQRVELKFQRLASDVTDVPSTKNLRGILRDLAKGATTGEEVREGLTDMAARAQALVNSLGFDSFFRAGATMFAKDMSSAERKDIQNASRLEDREPFRRAMLRVVTRDQLHHLLVAVKVPFVRARRLSAMPSFAALDALASLTVSFRWAVFGGIESTRKQLENDGIDMENVIIALYGRDFVSADRNARQLYEDLRAMADVLWP